jgi:hypothetical protein
MFGNALFFLFFIAALGGAFARSRRAAMVLAIIAAAAFISLFPIAATQARDEAHKMRESHASQASSGGSIPPSRSTHRRSP